MLAELTAYEKFWAREAELCMFEKLGMSRLEVDTQSCANARELFAAQANCDHEDDGLQRSIYKYCKKCRKFYAYDTTGTTSQQS